MTHEFSTIEAAIDAIRRGEVVVVLDAEDRENEGDFICAAEKVSTATVNFMITHGRGQLCMPILPDVSDRLELHPMVESNTAPLGTNYTVPVDHRSTRTGITAAEQLHAPLARSCRRAPAAVSRLPNPSAPLTHRRRRVPATDPDVGPVGPSAPAAGRRELARRRREHSALPGHGRGTAGRTRVCPCSYRAC